MADIIKFPIEIGKFTFYNNSFIHKTIRYDYNSIESLRFVVNNISINFSTDENYTFMIRMNDDAIFDLIVGDALFTINKRKVAEKKQNIRIIYNYLNKLTFNRRLENYLNQLKNNNYIVYKFSSGHKTVKIYNDGNVIMDNRVVNLKTARQAGTLKFGTAYGLGCDRTIDPYEISINEKKPILGGRAEGFGSMRIDGSWDYPIIFEILKSIS